MAKAANLWTWSGLVFSRLANPGKSGLLTCGLRNSAAKISLASPSLDGPAEPSGKRALGKDSSGSPSIRTGMTRWMPCNLIKVSTSIWHQAESLNRLEQTTIKNLECFRAS